MLAPVRMNMSNPTRAVDPAAVERFFSHAATLPTMPEVASRLFHTFGDENADLRTLADLIGHDQALTVRLLRLANSARYSRGSLVVNIQAAAAIIGMRSLRDLALASCVSNAFPRIHGFDRQMFWRKAVAAGGHARVLAERAGIDPDMAYLGGLVMRTGELMMRMADPDSMVQIDQRSRGQGSRLEHEWALLQCTHLHVTAGLMWRWNFPTVLSAGLLSAVDPMAEKPPSPLAIVLSLAGVLADIGESKQPLPYTLWQLRPEMLWVLGLDLNWLQDNLLTHQALTQGIESLI